MTADDLSGSRLYGPRPVSSPNVWHFLQRIFETRQRQNSALDNTVTERFIVIPSLSQYDLNNVERDKTHQFVKAYTDPSSV